MKISKIELAWIVVGDVKKAKTFYADILGLKVHEGDHEHGWLEFSGNDDGAMLGVAQENDQCPMRAGQNAVITFTVDNLDEAIKELTAKGIKFVGGVIEIPGHVKMISFVDADGNNFQLVSH